MLAGLVQNPVSYDPVNNPEAAITRRNVVLTRMKSLGLVSEKDVQAAMKQGFNRSRVTYPKTGCISSKYPFVCNYVYQSLLSSPNLGKRFISHCVAKLGVEWMVSALVCTALDAMRVATSSSAKAAITSAA